MAKVIAFEGNDGVGKTTLANWLHDQLAAKQLKVHYLTSKNLPLLATKLREILLHDKTVAQDNDVRTLMFVTYLMDIYKCSVKPRLNNHDYILMDRTILSTIVYQGNSPLLKAMSFQLSELMPIDVVAYLKASPEIAYQRIAARGNLDTIEKLLTPERLALQNRQFDNLIETYGFSKPVLRIDTDPSLLTVQSQFKQQWNQLGLDQL